MVEELAADIEGEGWGCGIAGDGEVARVVCHLCGWGREERVRRANDWEGEEVVVVSAVDEGLSGGVQDGHVGRHGVGGWGAEVEGGDCQGPVGGLMFVADESIGDAGSDLNRDGAEVGTIGYGRKTAEAKIAAGCSEGGERGSLDGEAEVRVYETLHVHVVKEGVVDCAVEIEGCVGCACVWMGGS